MNRILIVNLPRHCKGYASDTANYLHAVGSAIGLPTKIARLLTGDLKLAEVQIGDCTVRSTTDIVIATIDGPEEQAELIESRMAEELRILGEYQ